MPTPPRVLVVEDEPLIAQVLQDWLEELGCEVVGPARSVDAAMDLLNSVAVQAAILDVKVLDGATHEVGRVLQERGIGYIVATGYGTADLHPQFRGGPVLQKPFDFSTASSIISNILPTAR